MEKEQKKPSRDADFRAADKSRRKIRCAVIGTGRIGSSLETDRLREKPASHAGAIARNRDSVLVAGADPDADNLAAFGRLWRLPREALYADARAMIDAVGPDIVHIASDTEEHVPLLRLALEREVPVVVLEKPVATTVAEAREILPLVDEAESLGTSRVVVNHERRFARDYRAARELIRSNRLGSLLSVHARLYMGKTKTPEAVLWHDGTHLVDIVTFLAGAWEAKAVHGISDAREGNFFAFGETIEAGSAPDRSGSDAPPVSIVIDSSPGRDHLAFELDLSFAAGRLRIGNGIFEIWESRPSRLYERFRSLELVRGRPGKGWGRTGYFSLMMEHAVALSRDPTLPGESTFRDGLAAIETLARIIELGARPGRD
jgi:predicted dehydrogenase